MEKPVPMDRLICGDVGYGKTEIAVRAAFKAVQDGKQVAVLVPTTLLVQQHLDTFTERYAHFPVTVQPLSRFSVRRRSRTRSIAGLADGSVDVVIGTHRLLTGEIALQGPRAWSSSTRSSASGSSTRSGSSSCAPTSTCWR